MPQIKQYNAPTDVPKPNTMAYEANLTMGRRIGYLWNQAGDFTEKTGRTAAATEQLMGDWPFNFLKMQRAVNTPKPEPRGRSSGGGGGSHGTMGKQGGGSLVSDFPKETMPNLSVENMQIPIQQGDGVSLHEIS